MKRKLELKDIAELERELNKIQFRGVNVGSLLVSFFRIDFYFNQKNLTRRRYVLSTVKNVLYRYKLNRIFSQTSSDFEHTFAPYKHKKLLTFIDCSKRHLFDMQFPVLSKISKDGQAIAFVVSGSTHLLRELNNVGIVDASKLPVFDLAVWRIEFEMVWQEVAKVIKKFLSVFRLPFYAYSIIKEELIFQTQMLFSLEQMLKVLRPELILTEFDRYGNIAPLILAANKLKIITFTQQHGLVNDEVGYTPVLANKVLTWGSVHSDLYKQYGTDPANIEETGAPHFDEDVHPISDRTVQFNPQNRKVALLATNPIQTVSREHLCRIFCDTISPCEDIQGIVRIHPSEKLEDYDELANSYPNIFFTDSSRISYVESFSLADVICVYNSAFSFDALIKKKPVVVIDINRENLGFNKILVNYGVVSLARNPTEIVSTIRKIISTNNVVNVESSICLATGQRAVSNVLNVIAATY